MAGCVFDTRLGARPFAIASWGDGTENVKRGAAWSPAKPDRLNAQGDCIEQTARQSPRGAYNPGRIRVQLPPPTCFCAWGLCSRVSNAGTPAGPGGPSKRGCKPGAMRGAGPAAAKTTRAFAARSGTPPTKLSAPRQGVCHLRCITAGHHRQRE